MSRRRVSVEFVAELGAFRRGTRDGAADVRKLKTEAAAAKAEVARLGRDSVKAAADLKKFARDGRMSLADVGFASRGVREQMAGVADRTRQAARSFAEVNGTARAAVATLRMVSPVLTDISRRVQGMKLGRLGGGLLGAAGDLGGGASKLTMAGLASIPAAAAGAAAALQGIPPLLAAIGGGLGAIPALAAGAGAAVGVLALSFSGVGDAIEEAFEGPEDPYDGLSRNAQRFVDVLASQRRALLDLRSVAQQRVFADLDAEIVSLGQFALPFARKQVERFGDTWNQTFKQIARIGRNPAFLSGLDDAFSVTDAFFDKVNARIPTTGLALSRLFTGSMPFVAQFGDSLLEYVDDFNDWILRTSSRGQLRKFFVDAGQQADALLDLARELLVVVGRIGGMQQGSTLLRDMADAVARFNSEAQNMRSIEGIIATGNAAIRGLADVLMVVGETLGDTLADPGTRDAIVLFFDVLKVGAEIIGDLASLFTALPDPIQSTLLAGAALAILWGKLRGAGAAMAVAVGSANDRLREAGPAGQRAATGLQAASVWAGRAMKAFIALQVASAVFAALRGSGPDVERLSRSLQQLAVTGERVGELDKLFPKNGDGLIIFGDHDQLVGDLNRLSGGLNKVGLAGEAIVPGLRELNDLFTGGSSTGAKENIEALDQAMVRLVETSGKQAGIKAWNQLLLDSGMNADELIALLPGFGDALANADDAANRAATNQSLLNGTMEDAIALTGSYTRAWQQLNGAMLTSDESMLAAKEALDAVKDSFKENGKAIEGNSEAALRNRVAIGEASQKWAEAAQAKYEETGSIEEGNRVYNEYINQLRRTLDQAGLTDAQINTLIDTYAALPAYKQTKIAAPGVEGATDRANGFYFALRRLPNGKYVRVRVDGVESAIARVNRLQWEVNALTGKTIRIGVSGGRGGNLERWGGAYERAQTGLVRLRDAQVYSSQGPARYGFAEPETGGEAFIPRRGDRERSVSIGKIAMDWYGMDVVPKGGGVPQQRQLMAAQGGGGPSGPLQVALQVNAASGAASVLLSMLSIEVANRHGGDIQRAVSSVS